MLVLPPVMVLLLIDPVEYCGDTATAYVHSRS